MKKLIFIFVCFVVMGILKMQAQTANIILQHGDDTSFYEADQLQDAIDAAVDGDAIYLNEGTFMSTKHKIQYAGYYVIIEKDISVIGAGANKTYLNNSIHIGNCQVNIEDLKFDGLKNLQSIESLSLKRCIVTSGLSFVGNNGSGVKYTIDKLFVFQCQVNSFDFDYTMNAYDYTYGNVYGQISNSIIYAFGCEYFLGELNIKNCNVISYSEWCRSAHECVNYENCIIHYYMYGDDLGIRASSMVNCLYDGKISNVSKRISNCWYKSNIFDDNLNCSLTDEQLINNGFVGTDGTIIGINGGSFPFTLSSSRPSVSNYQIEIDPQTRKIKVKF